MTKKKVPVLLWAGGLYCVITALLAEVAISHHLWREFWVTQAALVAAVFAAVIILRASPDDKHLG